MHPIICHDSLMRRLQQVVHKNNVEYPRHHATLSSWQFLKSGAAISLEKLRNMSFANPLVGKDSDVGGGANNP